MKYQGVIFDLDGTLVNSLEDIADSMNRVLEKFSFPQHDVQAYRHFIGHGMRHLVSEALPAESRDENLISLCFEAMMKEYSQHCTDKTRPYDGIEELLTELQKRNLKLAVFSNKIDELTKIVVSTLFPNFKFQEILGSRPDLPRKPNPLGAVLISESLGISPSNLVYVGDSGVDMQVANSAGMYPVGVLWGFRPADELKYNGARSLIEYPLDLLHLME